jgi:hypothetical protein
MIPGRFYAIFVMFAMCLPGYLLSVVVLSKVSFIAKEELPYYSLLLSPILVSLFSTPILFLGIRAAVPGMAVQITGGIAIISNRNYREVIKKSFKFDYRLVIVTIMVGLGAALFISNLELPLYTDSAHHYADIAAFSRITPLSWSLPARFYHFGYHLFLAQAHHLSGINIAELMLASGVNMLIFCVVGVFALGLVLTKDQSIAVISACVVCLTGVFPSFAQNWGKYPAMFSLALMPFVQMVMVNFFQNRWNGNYLAGFCILAGSTLVVGLGHWRSIFFLVAAALAAFIVCLLRKNEKMTIVRVGLAIALAGLAVFEVINLNISIANKLLWILVLLSVIFISLIFAKTRSGSQVLFPLLLFAFILLATKMPLPERWMHYSSPIDLPYYRIALFIPAGMLLAAALSEISAGFEISLDRQEVFWLVLLGSLVLAPMEKKLTADERYVIVELEQMEALNWIDEHYAESEVTFLVAGQALPDVMEVSDSGAWIGPLTGLEVVVLPAMIDFSLEEQRDLLCEAKLLVYIDHTNHIHGFDDTNLDENLYQSVFYVEPVRIVKPICGD